MLRRRCSHALANQRLPLRLSLARLSFFPLPCPLAAALSLTLPPLALNTLFVPSFACRVLAAHSPSASFRTSPPSHSPAPSKCQSTRRVPSPSWMTSSTALTVYCDLGPTSPRLAPALAFLTPRPPALPGTIFAYGQTGTGKTFTMNGAARGRQCRATALLQPPPPCVRRRRAAPFHRRLKQGHPLPAPQESVNLACWASFLRLLTTFSTPFQRAKVCVCVCRDCIPLSLSPPFAHPVATP